MYFNLLHYTHIPTNMKVNFEIEDNYAISFKGKHIDLHNNFDFLGFEYDVTKMIAILRWEKSTEEWANKETIKRLSIIHKNVSYLSITPRDAEMPTTEDSCLKDITYLPIEFRTHKEEFILPTKLPEPNNDIVYRFHSEQFITINCHEIELIITEA